MPNHVSGRIEFVGSREDIEALAEFVYEDEKNPISADKVIPYPQKFKDLDAKHHELYGSYFESTQEQKDRAKADHKNGTYVKDGYNSGGYEWCVNNWGTKWGFYDVSTSGVYPHVNKDKYEIDYDVTTAWSPAIPIIMRLSEMFPTVKIRYYFEDEGWCFDAGYADVQNSAYEETTYTYEEIDDWKQLEIFEEYDSWRQRQDEYEAEEAEYQRKKAEEESKK